MLYYIKIEHKSQKLSEMVEKIDFMLVVDPVVVDFVKQKKNIGNSILKKKTFFKFLIKVMNY